MLQTDQRGYRLAVFFTKAYARIVNATLAELDPTLPAEVANRNPIPKVGG